jgi:precorrin-6B methylase 2
MLKGLAFSQHRQVLDLGGGTGSVLLDVLRQHRGLAATLFERPAVAAISPPVPEHDPVCRRHHNCDDLR